MTQPPPQFSFHLPQSPAYQPEDFVVAPCNHSAYHTISQWPHWTQPVLILHGPPASGKTHLAHIWAQQSGAHYLTARHLDAQAAARIVTHEQAARPWVVEDIGQLADEAALFHLLNAIREQQGWLLLTADSPPSRLRITLPDLRSRLHAAPLVSLEAPDDTVLTAVVFKQFADRQLRVSDEVVQYLLKRIDRSFSAARDWVQRIDDAALAAHSNITVTLVRRLMEAENALIATTQKKHPDD